MKSIIGKTVIVTGAGKGIGFVMVEALLREGAKVFATSRDVSRLKAIQSEKLYVFSADLTKTGIPDEIVCRCAEVFGGVDIVINNAALAKKALLSDTSVEDWDSHFAVNVRAPFLLVNAAMAYLLESDHAAVINICSVVATKGYETQGAYTASKHALLGYTKVLARELFDQGVRVHAISPGGVSTEMVREVRPDLNPELLSTPQEIADIALFLLKNRGNAVIDHIEVRRHTKTPWV